MCSWTMISCSKRIFRSVAHQAEESFISSLMALVSISPHCHHITSQSHYQAKSESADRRITSFQNPLSFNICSLASHNFSSISLSRTFATKASPCWSLFPKGRKKPPLPSSIGLEIGSKRSAKKKSFRWQSPAPQNQPDKLPSLTHHHSWRTLTSSWPHLPGRPCQVPSPIGQKT